MNTQIKFIYISHLFLVTTYRMPIVIPNQQSAKIRHTVCLNHFLCLKSRKWKSHTHATFIAEAKGYCACGIIKQWVPPKCGVLHCPSVLVQTHRGKSGFPQSPVWVFRTQWGSAVSCYKIDHGILSELRNISSQGATHCMFQIYCLNM